MTPARRLRLAAIGALALVTLGGSLAALVALNAGGEARVGPVALMQVAAGYDRRAAKLRASPAAESPASLAEIGALSRASIRQLPYDTRAWLQLAYVDYLQHGQLTQDGLADLQRSYDLVAIDTDVGLWRIGLALENSSVLPKDLRNTVREEVFTLWAHGYGRQRMREMLTTMKSPAGRLTLALWLDRLQRYGAN